MKAIEELKEFRGLEIPELKAKVKDAEEELLKLRFRGSMGQLEQTAQIGSLRRRIARAKTIIIEKRSN